MAAKHVKAYKFGKVHELSDFDERLTNPHLLDEDCEVSTVYGRNLK